MTAMTRQWKRMACGLGLCLLVGGGALAGCGGSPVAPAAPAAASAAAAPSAGAAVSACAPAFSEADRAAVERLLADQATAWNRGDLEGYMGGYLRSPDLVFTSGSKVRTGYDETIASYRKKYGDDRASMGTLAFTILRIDPVGRGGAVVLGRWDLSLVGGMFGGVFSVVLERRPEGWLIVHDHTSSDPPPPPK
jgi:ketosteroid isomerase-like protein